MYTATLSKNGEYKNAALGKYLFQKEWIPLSSTPLHSTPDT